MATGFTNTPKLFKGGIVIMDAAATVVQGVVALQYNPDSLSRSFQIQSTPGGHDGVRVDALRLRGPAIETLKIEAELNAIEQLEFPKQFPSVVKYGLHPQLAELEMLVNPSVQTLMSNNNLANNGALEIIPLEQPLTLFVWSQSRVIPVRITEFSITEEAFDPNLNPIRAKISLGMRVLTVDDLGFNSPGGQLFMAYLGSRQQLATNVTNLATSVLGLGGLP